MTILVSNDKPLTLGAETTPGGRTRNLGQAAAPAPDQQPAPPEQGPDVERAAHLYRTANGAGPPSSGALQTEQQALSALERLKAQMSDNPARALGAFGQANPQQSAALLAQAPG